LNVGMKRTETEEGKRPPLIKVQGEKELLIKVERGGCGAAAEGIVWYDNV